nr:hypothetical protein Iba_chr05eCG0910 [Ipomoea batatas]GMD64513.1 hypothetical protein Iba_scaffold49309CG0010 [Ipomoea batatas]GME05814.1 hypothetical protein Iba_scaffold3421CG0050 [Ipomoea batatas]GME10557.1 hypothetical protein Iba_scaffold10236CG0020 [Ipomoea batatas]
MSRISLSMVFGTPTTATFRRLLTTSLWIALAPACVPFPPSTKSILIPLCSILSTMSVTLGPPRETPNKLPPER